MIDLKILRSSYKEVALALKKKGYDFDIETWSQLESERKVLQTETENLQSNLNNLSKEIGILKRDGQDSSNKENDASVITSEIKTQSKILESLLNKINDFLLGMPNIPDADVPEGVSEEDNIEIRTWGKARQFDFKVLDHLELGQMHAGIDMEAGAKITGSRFSVLKSDFSRLQRSLVNFMLDVHTKEHDYQEVYVPYIVNSDSLTGTGNLPKFEEDLFKLQTEQSFYLAPTAEVPVTNLFRNEIIESKDLPIKYVAHTPCFRSEAGSYGKDTKGIMRLHQFEKVELVQAV